MTCQVWSVELGVYFRNVGLGLVRKSSARGARASVDDQSVSVE